MLYRLPSLVRTLLSCSALFASWCICSEIFIRPLGLQKYFYFRGRCWTWFGFYHFQIKHFVLVFLDVPSPWLGLVSYVILHFHLRNSPLVIFVETIEPSLIFSFYSSSSVSFHFPLALIGPLSLELHQLYCTKSISQFDHVKS